MEEYLHKQVLFSEIMSVFQIFCGMFKLYWMKFYSEVIKEICFLGFKLKQEKITTVPVYIN